MKRTLKLSLMICLSALAVACAPKALKAPQEPKYLALAFDDGHTMYTVVPDGRYN